MIFSWRWLLIAFALILSSERNFAASSTKEERAYAAAVSAFQDGMWSRAEAEFAQFIGKYPKSTYIADAVLMQAQAEFKQGKLANCIALLKERKAGAGSLADQYVYWIGEAQFQDGDFSQAADTFTGLMRDFTSSLLRLRAVVGAASAHGRLGEWGRVSSLLEEPGGVFQRAAEMDAANELVSRGRLLLAQAKFIQKDFNGASAVLQLLTSQPLKLELDWQRASLLYQVKLAAGDLNAALAATTNLVQIARLGRDEALSAESTALHATVLERMGRTTEAVVVYQENLLTNAPVEQQRQAVLKIAELAIKQNQLSNAEQSLETFLARFTNSPSADITLLTLGELHLKDYIAQPTATNHLVQATMAFDQFIVKYTNSPFLGKAYLNRGWCFWLVGKNPESFGAFQAAAQRLPLSEDLAVARFKMGDALFAQKDFAGALTNYSAVLDGFADFPAINKTLGVQALYQTLRGSLKLKDMDGAINAMAQILKLSPASDVADNSVLLVSEGLADFRRPAAARELLQQFEEQFPNSGLLPQVELAVARTYEQEQNWPAAILKYDDWRDRFPTNALRPQADYAQAWVNFQAGNETNSFVQFTNFVAQFPANALAPQAQWWVADHFFRAGNFVEAEKNYQLLFQSWPSSDLAYEARMMAGRAAMGRLGYSDAIRYFTSLTTDTNCPPDLNAQALFAYGSALMRSDSTETNRPLANFDQAAGIFRQICDLYPTNELGALAWGERGNCYLQLGTTDPTFYDKATNAYALVFGTNSLANISARSQAQIGFGIALEKKATLATGDEQADLLKLARDNYLDVFDTVFGKNLRPNELADPFWVKKSGLQALPLVETFGMGSPGKFITKMEELLPQLTDLLEKKRAALLAEKK